ncbi:hypothetical protein [Klebsiella phage 05F01]|nr:hypothetical protein [Klebsiella phage 05F01]
MTRRNEEHVDERAYPFFHHVYGRDGYVGEYNSTSGAKPTKVLSIEGFYHKYCAYCGRKALPIQGELEKGRGFFTGYYDIGHCCVCKDAMDEVEHNNKLVELKKRHENELLELEESRPKLNQEVVSKLVEKVFKERQEQLKKDLQDFEKYPHMSTSTLSKVGVTLIEGDKDV